MKTKKEMRVLCVHQPYAWLIANGYKDVENRSNPPHSGRIGQRFLVFASKRKVTKSDYESFLSITKKFKIRRYPKSIEEFEYGALVGSAVLNGFKWNSKSYWANDDLCHWLVSQPRKMKPIKMQGQQTLFFKVKI